ncbi:hypothetical protein C1645_762431 [Glomus cerebriforme]|uniref:Uncharacterized protein n=1 Tax=Glomus cerebriforme TaxID=658196 RepID=A0A397T9C7_9GLOM|nr:hypothetical protein C1645_762431 [Glomus cerebriforme]
MSLQDNFSNFPPLEKAIRLSTYLICDRPAREIRNCLNELINSINKQLSVMTSIPKRRASFSAKTTIYGSNTINTINTINTQNIPTRTPSRTPSRTPTTPRYSISPKTPTTPTTPRVLTHHKSSHTISNNNSINNNNNVSKQVIKTPYYWQTLYINTKICLMDLEYWERGIGHPENRTSDSFFKQPNLIKICLEVKTMDQKKVIESILTDLGKIQEVVLEKVIRVE